MPIPYSVLRVTPTSAPAAPFTQYGAALGPSGGAIVGVRHGGDRPRVIDARTFPASLAAIGDALEALLATDATCRVVIDGGLHGLDLMAHLGGRRRRVTLFEATRPELRRFEIAGKLRTLVESQAFVIERPPGEAVLRKAISGATREDAAERPEIVALSLALVSRRRVPNIW